MAKQLFLEDLVKSSTVLTGLYCRIIILWPRVAVPQISLSSSLSGRLKANASIRGGHASPMFPLEGKKRGCAHEEHEPSSPKVTCIGHVRVKTKKQGKKREANHHHHHSGEVSFRRVEVGTSEGEGGGRRNQGGGRRWGSCGAVIARWLVALHEGPDDKGGGRKIELVIGEEEHVDERSGSYRRQVFEGIEFDEKGIRGFEGKEGVEEERGRVSVCIPPKNALLLMRCRSDPVKMAALVGRFCNDPVRPADVHDDGKEDLDNVSGTRDLEVIRGCRDDKEVREQLIGLNDGGGDAIQGAVHCATIEEDDEEEAEVNLLANELYDLISSNIEEETAMEEVPGEPGVSSFVLSDGEKGDPSRSDDAGNSAEEHDGEKDTSYGCVLSVHFPGDSEDRRELTEAEAEVSRSLEAKMGLEREENRKEMTWLGSDLNSRGKLESEKKIEAPKLPDCLLLMMREPKLSMEVSKETWVCSNDFLRWLPQRPVASRIPRKVDTREDDSMKVQVGAEEAEMKLPPDATTCLWKNRRLEPHHRPVNNLVKAAGFGY
ncbi:hypothetical protein MLD38_000485 [Melastoma candidum]|uniref:Uncharacterized protein n=1 Tax=Melastoma candidum TaxID=119954 RepID=A0ACB9SBH9_9MYRT|nr:hypothetical protein MLD38_000485 [Melastoma candidum]